MSFFLYIYILYHIRCVFSLGMENVHTHAQTHGGTMGNVLFSLRRLCCLRLRTSPMRSNFLDEELHFSIEDTT